MGEEGRVQSWTQMTCEWTVGEIWGKETEGEVMRIVRLLNLLGKLRPLSPQSIIIELGPICRQMTQEVCSGGEWNRREDDLSQIHPDYRDHEEFQ